MKAILTLFIVGALCLGAQAQQHFVAGSYIEATIMGNQAGGWLGYQTRKNGAYGLFFQKNTRSTEQTSFLANSFYGGVAKLNLVNSFRMSFAMVFRAGLANDKFLVIVPGTETKIHFTKGLHFTTGLAWRAGEPAVSMGITFKLF